MKQHTTNYCNSFIEIAEDCPTAKGEIPPLKNGSKTIANIQFDIISKHPYKFTSDDVLFQTYAFKNDIKGPALKIEREKYFSKGQPCFRASPLPKRYGWGVHHNEEGKIAIYGAETSAYKNFLKDNSQKCIKAMKSTK